MHHFSIILPDFTIIYTLYDCCIYIVKILYNDAWLHISSHLYIQWRHIGSLKLATLGVFTPWKSAATIKESFSLLPPKAGF